MGKELCRTCKPNGECWYERAKIETSELARDTTANAHGLKKKEFAKQGLFLIQAGAIAIGCKEVRRDLQLPKLDTRRIPRI